MHNDLSGAGVGVQDERVLRALLIRTESTAQEMASTTGQPVDEVVAALARLTGLGLVGRLAGTPVRYTAADPRTALDALIHPAEEAVRRARDATAELTALFRTARANDSAAGPVEVVSGHEVSRAFVRMQQSAVREVRAFDRPPYVHTAGNPIEPSVLARGVRWRAVYHPDALEVPDALAEIRSLVALGEQARMLTDVPFKMCLVDDRVAMVALDPESASVRSALVYPSALLQALTLVFESCWQRAVPVDAAAGQPGISDEDRQLLALLAAGVKDDAIGRQLGLSVRTMRRRVRSLLDLLDARTRFQAGMEATRRNWI